MIELLKEVFGYFVVAMLFLIFGALTMAPFILDEGKDDKR